MSVPVIRYDRQRADDAWSVNCALIAFEHLRPELKSNPAWTILRQDAYELYLTAFEKVTS